jgi:hypothetical protein
VGVESGAMSTQPAEYLSRQLELAWSFARYHLESLSVRGQLGRLYDRPFVDVVAWANVELMKNAAEIGFGRLLYAVR